MKRETPRHIFVCPVCWKRVKGRDSIPARSDFHQQPSYCEATGRYVVPLRYRLAALKPRAKVKP